MDVGKITCHLGSPFYCSIYDTTHAICVLEEPWLRRTYRPAYMLQSYKCRIDEQVPTDRMDIRRSFTGTRRHGAKRTQEPDGRLRTLALGVRSESDVKRKNANANVCHRV
jgi:hypothetical protein